MSWFKRAACLGSSTETFFEEDRSLEAIAICQLCPVKSDCFEYAIKHEDYGVWGATTEEERRAYRATFGLELKPLGVKPRFIPKHASCGTETGYQNIRQWWARNKDKPRPHCEPCFIAHQDTLIYDRSRRRYY